MDMRDDQRRSKLERENRIKAEIAHAKQEEHRKKIQEAKKKTEMMMEHRKQEFDQKQQ